MGCPDLEPPVGAWFSRDTERGVIKCNFTSQTWHLVCRDNQWVGSFSNCTLGEYTTEINVSFILFFSSIQMVLKAIYNIPNTRAYPALA